MFWLPSLWESLPFATKSRWKKRKIPSTTNPFSRNLPVGKLPKRILPLKNSHNLISWSDSSFGECSSAFLQFFCTADDWQMGFVSHFCSLCISFMNHQQHPNRMADTPCCQPDRFRPLCCLSREHSAGGLLRRFRHILLYDPVNLDCSFLSDSSWFNMAEIPFWKREKMEFQKSVLACFFTNQGGRLIYHFSLSVLRIKASAYRKEEHYMNSKFTWAAAAFAAAGRMMPGTAFPIFSKDDNKEIRTLRKTLMAVLFNPYREIGYILLTVNKWPRKTLKKTGIILSGMFVRPVRSFFKCPTTNWLELKIYRMLIIFFFRGNQQRLPIWQQVKECHLS